MKAYDLKPALDPLLAFCPDPPPIICLQNGIGVEQPLIDHFGAERIVAGALTVPIRKDASNSLIVEHTDRGLGLAPTQPGQDIGRWLDLFQEAGILTVGIADFQAMKWSKALLNIIGNATSAILNRTPAAVYQSKPLFELEVRMLKEALAVMDRLKLQVVDLPGAATRRLASGVKRAPMFVLKPVLTQIVAKGRGDKMPSFHIDLAAGKQKSEVVYHNGAIARAGQELGIHTPVNRTLTDILWQLIHAQIDWREFDGNPRRLLAEVRKAA